MRDERLGSVENLGIILKLLKLLKLTKLTKLINHTIKILAGTIFRTRAYLGLNSLFFHLFPKKMESKTARGAIFGVVACRQGGARFAHLKGVIDAFPLKSRLGSAEDTSPAEAGAWGWVRFINAFS